MRGLCGPARGGGLPGRARCRPGCQAGAARIGGIGAERQGEPAGYRMAWVKGALAKGAFNAEQIRQ